MWLDELRHEGRNCTESEINVGLSQEALDNPVKFGVERPVIPGTLSTGIAQAKRMKELTGINRAKLWAQWSFRAVDVYVKRLFEASANLCLDFEARSAPSKDETEPSNRFATESLGKAKFVQESRTGSSAKLSGRRNAKYEEIDAALMGAAESKPKTHQEVFRALDGRTAVPNAKPFSTARGWWAGFERDPVRARAWLSKQWSRLRLPSFPRGPKK
jgi:hypothetical protein